jgi:hypothetical protein
MGQEIREEMGPIIFPEMSVWNYHYRLCNVPEERRSHVKDHYLLLIVYTSRVILRIRGQKLTSQYTNRPTWRQLQKIVEKFLLFTENLMLITAFTKARHWFLFWNIWIENTFSFHITLTSLSIKFPSTPWSSRWLLKFMISQRQFLPHAFNI